MKKIKTLFLCVILICTFAFLTSCGKDEEQSHVHTWSEWSVLVEPTCEAKGEQECVCTGCKEEKREIINELEHEYIKGTVLVEATCQSDGIKIFSCKHCGTLKEETLEKISHNIVNNTCTECNASVVELTKYTVTVDFNDGIGNDPSGEYAQGDTVYLPNPTKEDYIFRGWYTTEDYQENSKVGNAVVVNKNITIYAKWEFEGSYITLDAGTGYVQKTTIVVYSNDIFELEVPKSSNGQFFEGWYLGKQQITDETGTLLENWNLLENVTLTAKWVDEKEVNGVKYIYSGFYPQSVVNDNDIISTLDKITGVNELGYLEYNGLKYEKVTYKQGSYQAKFNDGTPLVDGKTYYFLVEPVLWRVIDKDNCAAVTDQIIDARYYAKSDKVNTIKPSVSANNYEYSDVNNWLNADGDYIDTNFAFKVCGSADEVVKNIIFTVGLENGLISTKDETNPYVCDNFTAYFYLMSCAEYVDSYKEVLGATKATDYAICKGVLVNHYTMNAEWWLRTPSADGAGLAKYVTCTGDVASTSVTNANIGIRPIAAFKSLAVLGGEKDE